MKKIVCFILMFAMVVSISPYSSAEDNFAARHNALTSSEEYLDVDIVYPIFDGFVNSDLVNTYSKDLITNSVEEAKESAKVIKESESDPSEENMSFVAGVRLDINYDYIKGGEILSLKFNSDYFEGGAHPVSSINPITINTKTGEILKFSDLFKVNSDFKDIISGKIIEEITENEESYLEGYSKAVLDRDGDFKFYIDGDSIVVYFDEYELAPHSTGIPSFVFEAEEIQDILKDEVYKSIKDLKKRGPVSFNGLDINSKNQVIEGETLLIPLRDIAEALGYQVDWDREKGAMIAGGFIKDGVNSYSKKDQDDVSLSNAPVIKDGVMYVPLEYFTEVLEENVSFGTVRNKEIIVRAYGEANEDKDLKKELEL